MIFLYLTIFNIYIFFKVLFILDGIGSKWCFKNRLRKDGYGNRHVRCVTRFGFDYLSAQDKRIFPMNFGIYSGWSISKGSWTSTHFGILEYLRMIYSELFNNYPFNRNYTKIRWRTE